MNIATSIIEYLKGSRQELKKVVWPSRKEITQHTILVIAVSLGVALFLGLIVDYTLTAIVSALL